MRIVTAPEDHAPTGFFVLRTPLLPLARWSSWSIGLKAVETLKDDDHLAVALSHDRALLRTRLVKVLQIPEVREACFVAAPSLEGRIDSWLDDPDSESGRKIERALVRYFSRMSTRSTPFGLFAGCSVGILASKTELVVSSSKSAQRKTRLDAGFLLQLLEQLNADNILRNELTFRPNPTLYQLADRIRYIKVKSDGNFRSHSLVQLENTETLRATLERAIPGIPADDLARSLIGEEINFPIAREYIDELINEQVLISNLSLVITGPEVLDTLIDMVQKNVSASPVARVLHHARNSLSELDRNGIGIAPDQYRTIASALGELDVPLNLNSLFQVDMIKPGLESTLGPDVIDEMLRGMKFLHHLGLTSLDTPLTRFADRFAARYENQEVPLLEVLDEEGGIGFEGGEETSPLLKDLSFGTQNEPGKNGLTILLQEKLDDVWRRNDFELVLTEHDWKRVVSANTELPLPDSLSIQAVLAATDREALGRGEFYLHWQSAFGPSGAKLLGRFCHFDSPLRDHVATHLRIEESHRPETIFAEIVHLPSGRLANVLARPRLRSYEIPCLGTSGADLERQIPLDDLLVSVKAGLIRLRSRRLNREIVPRMTTAHNYRTYGVSVYRFLCMLQDQRVMSALRWTWGAWLNASFLPRVRLGRLVFALAQWRVTRDEAKEFTKLRGAQLFRAVQNWRATRQLPRLVMLQEGDHVLPVDLENILSVEAFVQRLHSREVHTLNEFFPAPDQLCVSGPEGLFTHELVVPFAKRNAAREESAATWTRKKTELHSVPPASRRFPPGSTWLYLKLYTSAATADRVLLEPVRNVVSQLKPNPAFRGWFFVRYADPENHLRLRWHGNQDWLNSEAQQLLMRCLRPWFDNGAIRQIQFDTYEREVERYGGINGIELSEQLFCADSEAVLEMLELIEPGDAGMDERWRLVCSGIDFLLEDFGLSLMEKRELLKQAHSGLVANLRVNKQLLGQIGNKFRVEGRAVAEQLVHNENHPLAPGFSILQRRSEVLKPIVKRLREAERDDLLTTSAEELLLSYMHMHANRILRSAPREHELVIYDLLRRHYESILMRSKSPH